MARVPYLTVNDLSEENKDLLKRGITLHRALVNSPNAARAFGGLGQFIRFKSRLDPRLREMAILQVGWVTRAPYEWSHHIKIGMGFGVTKDDIRAIIADTEGKPTALRALDRLVLRAAREAVAGPGIAEAAASSAPQSDTHWAAKPSACAASTRFMVEAPADRNCSHSGILAWVAALLITPMVIGEREKRPRSCSTRWASALGKRAR